MTTPPVKDDAYWNGEGISDPDNPYASPDNKPGSANFDENLAAQEASVRKLAKSIADPATSAETKQALITAQNAFYGTIRRRKDEREAEALAQSEAEAGPKQPRLQAKIDANKRRQAGTSEEDWAKTLVPMKGGVLYDPETKLYYQIQGDMSKVLTEEDTKKLFAGLAAATNLLEGRGGQAAILRPIQKVEAAAQENLANVTLESQKPEEPPTLPRYIKNIQALMINDIDTISEHFKKLDASRSKEDKPQNIFSLSDQIPGGTFMSRMAGYAHPSGLMSAFIHATPAQLAMLVPTMRFFMVDYEDNQEEIYFSEYGSAKHIKKMADIRKQGGVYELLGPKNQAGAEAGISSFQWRFHTRDEADVTLQASLQLYFGSLTELTNINYLQFLFPTGIDTTDAMPIKDTKKGRERDSSPAAIAKRKRTALSSQIEKLTDVLGKSESKIRELASSGRHRASALRNFRKLKVVVGWAVPKGSEFQLKKLFPSEASYKAFKNGVQASNRAIVLNHTNHDITFSQEGPTTIDISYVGSVRNYLTNDSSDIFGSNNFDNSGKRTSRLWQPVSVSVEGFKMRKGKVVDPKTAEPGQKGAEYIVGESVSALSVNKEISPYLKSKERVPAINEQGENTIIVTMGGLKLAGELVRKRIQLLEILNTPIESDSFTDLRTAGTMLSLLYHRAHQNQKRDLYSSFLEALIESGERLFKARVVLAEDGKSKVEIIYDPSKIAARDRRREMQNETDSAKQARLAKQKAEEAAAGMSIYASEEQPLPPKENEVDVYYMRLGDLLKTAMEQAGIRNDISFILGNHETKTGYRYSLYDIPITLGTFGQLFYDRIVSPGLLQLPYNIFQKHLLRYVSSAFNRDPQSTEDIAFETSVLATSVNPNNLGIARTTSGKALSNSDLRELGSGELNPLVGSRSRLHHYYTIYARSLDMSRLKGIRSIDEKEGIFHYVVGSDRGLAKRFDFSKQAIPYATEMNIEAGTGIGVAKAVFLPQDVTIQMYGNGIHKVGDLIFVDSSPALGSYAGPILAIGGYYGVKFATHTIRAGGTYETSLDCVFQKRDPRGGPST
jgi:hypothetical protein